MPFLWGAATSSHQIEGQNFHNDWWAWEAEGHIEGGVRSGRCTDHWNRYKEDLELAHSMGLNSYRFSIEWSRIEPEPGEWNDDALLWYENLIRECEKLGIVPMLTLHHFTSPLWFAKLGGFTSPDAPAYFLRFVEKVIDAFGARVPLWCTLNEPMVLVAGSYLGQFMPPAVFNPKLASLATKHLIDCHVAAYQMIHARVRERRGPFKWMPLQVGIAHNMLAFKPDRSWHPMERLLSKVLAKFYNEDWIRVILGLDASFSVPFVVPSVEMSHGIRGKRHADFIGLNYYTKAYLQWRPRDSDASNVSQLPIGMTFARRKEATSDLDWAVYPKGLLSLLRALRPAQLPIYITENGIADREDKLRPAYLRDHLGVVADAIAEGIPVQGYYHWSLLDNFEWSKGFGPRFGLVRVNYETFERTLTQSAHDYKKIIGAHGGTQAPTRELLNSFDRSIER